ncbi:MAG: sigma-70 family RNA polymerase sigma factor [Vicinamibacteria bacterium]|nr:sigma-70 family RNA polymerase sigma factor [Vicinamibacteria bacterium]
METMVFPCFVKTADEIVRPETRSGGLAPDAQALLVERISEGDGPAEEELVRLFQRRVLAMMLSRVRDPETARDLTQEVLMAVVLALRQRRIRDGTKLVAFVYGTARNIVNGYFRARPPETVPLSPDLFATNDADILGNLHRASLVARLLSRLDALDRRILAYILIDGLEPREIALRLGLSSEVVRARKSRAIKRAIACRREPPA